MTTDDFESAHRYASQAQYRRHRYDLLAAAYPHAKKNWQEKHFKEVTRACEFQSIEKSAISTEDLALLLSSKGGGAR
jgi:hypothetical protein